ncbi:MAG TPA: hypothetical protein VFS10_05055 [Pyrinomonadaceae bacterium]|nr:hypothetical protein [Pyrinomonadaceae bacterium]
MPTPTLEQLLGRLDELKRPTDARGRARLRGLLAQLTRRRFPDAVSLIRFHEILLFMRAYPQGRALLAQTEKLLSTFKRRVDELRGAEDFSEFERPEVSGIAGTSFSAIFTYDVVRWLVARHPSRVRVDWEGYAEEGQLAAVLPRFLPLVEENAYVETYFPFREYLRAARGKERNELVWLVERFESLPVSASERAALFDSLRLWVRWDFGDTRASRTRMKLGARRVFFHDAPLLTRRDVSLARELKEEDALPVVRLSRAEGARLLDAGRETMTARFRELRGFTYGDPASVVRADVGRGVEVFAWGLPFERRLPVLAYHSMLVLKNGVPCGYAEALSLFERVEAGLNLFYTFREGESAWIYARLLRLFRQLLGASVFSIDPYQLGFKNEEGIESGAFWFYRKLGFRPVQPRLAALVAREERRLASRTGLRTSAKLLRELSSGHVIFEAPSAQAGEWDGFHVRNLGLAVARRMAARHGGDASKLRRASATQVAAALGVNASDFDGEESIAFENLSLLAALVPDLNGWTEEEKKSFVRVVRAKAGRDESKYLRLMQKHRRLRREIIRLGSAAGRD